MGRPINPLPPIERLTELLDYDPATGVLTWKVTRGRAVAGARAGSGRRGHAYRVVSIDHTLYAEHRLAYALYHGTDPWPAEVDHWDQDPLNNRITNLRVATLAQQNANRVLPHRRPIKVTWPDGSTCVARGVGAAAWLTQIAHGTIKQRVRRNRRGLTGTQRGTATGIEVERA